MRKEFCVSSKYQIRAFKCIDKYNLCVKEKSMLTGLLIKGITRYFHQFKIVIGTS